MADVTKIGDATYDQAHRDILRLLSCVCFNAAGLTEGTNANTLQTANAINYAIDGKVYAYAATNNIAMTACAVQAVSTYCKYLVSINAAATVTTTKGTAVATDTAVLPDLPASSAPIGYFKIVTDAATTFTSGTTDLGAAGITETYVDLHSMVVSATGTVL